MPLRGIPVAASNQLWLALIATVSNQLPMSDLATRKAALIQSEYKIVSVARFFSAAEMEPHLAFQRCTALLYDMQLSKIWYFKSAKRNS